MMRQAPLGHDGSTARHNAGYALGGERHIAQQHASMNCKVVHTLLGLLNQGIAINFPAKILGNAIYLLQRLINWHSSDRHHGVTNNPLPGFMDILAGRQIHHRVRAPEC